MLRACLATQTNYVDITGEIEVLEAIWSQEEEIRRAGITAVPGAGFDVVPTDCLAAHVGSNCRDLRCWCLRSVGSKGHLRVRCAPPSARCPHLSCAGAQAQSSLLTTSLPLDRFRLGRCCVCSAVMGRCRHRISEHWRTGTSLSMCSARHCSGLRTLSQRGSDPLLRSRPGQRILAALVRCLPEGPGEAERAGHRTTICGESHCGFRQFGDRSVVDAGSLRLHGR